MTQELMRSEKTYNAHFQQKYVLEKSILYWENLFDRFFVISHA